ncbi:histidinol dehydrogenase [Leifsonia sp. TF02-11]|uniref:histidinol dehydrogenase n=1 Tax=Leifsonia sp. TF02-11 TaxID=2815212 RepID=UPI001AA142E5|nr:histidinol dehydrogenase [Leifsonia sp. TF02-11]MBO1740608.1 histidinol dehydrogenase [Leifsonia sp. TF02-11]
MPEETTISSPIAVRDLRGHDVYTENVAPRAFLDIDAVLASTRPIIEAVKTHGVDALMEFAEKFDRVRPPALRVPGSVLKEALSNLDPTVREALDETIRRVRAVHHDQRREEHTTTLAPGATVTERWLPVDRVGLYVPGGRAVYPSSVVMNVVAAQEADVPSLAISSPPQVENGGWPHPVILAAAAMLGVEEVYAVGGAQAIAMFAHGVRDADGTWLCAPVSMVTGPGNIYVAAAKRALRGVVGIDSEAGPTEIAILADDSADPEWVAADLISQAEHDVIAASVLVTTSADLAEDVIAALDRQIVNAKHSERIREALGGQQSAILIVDDLEAGLAVVNAYGAEHLEVQTRDAAAVARQIRNAGAIFVGGNAPVALGDYCAGSNHVLPTGGSAAHASGLSVQTFLRGVHLIEYDATALGTVEPFVTALADAEDLPAHGFAARVRFSTSLSAPKES